MFEKERHDSPSVRHVRADRRRLFASSGLPVGASRGRVSRSASHNSCQTQSGVFMHSRLLISLFRRSRRVQRLRSPVLVDFRFSENVHTAIQTQNTEQNVQFLPLHQNGNSCLVKTRFPHTSAANTKQIKARAGMLDVMKVFPCLSNPAKISARLRVVTASSHHDLLVLTLIKVKAFLTSFAPFFIHSSLNSTVNRRGFEPFSVLCLCPPLHFASAVI